MIISNQWSAMRGKGKPAQAKPRVLETNSGFLIVAITDETPDDAYASFEKLMLANAERYDACKTQSEVWNKANMKHTSALCKQAGIIDS